LRIKCRWWKIFRRISRWWTRQRFQIRLRYQNIH
jgi:hypothetical protein